MRDQESTNIYDQTLVSATDLNFKLCDRFAADLSKCLTGAIEDAISKLANGMYDSRLNANSVSEVI